MDAKNANAKLGAINACNNCNNSNTLIFTVARMNPPTPGHLELIREMLTMAKNKGIKQIYIFLSEKQGAKDPISCADKATALTGLYDRVTDINIWANVAEFVRDSMQNTDKAAQANDVAINARSAAVLANTNVNVQPKLKSMIQSLQYSMTVNGIDVADITVNAICFSGSNVFKYIDYYANNLTQSLIPPNNPKSVYLVGFFGGDRDDFGVAIEKSFKNKYSYFAPPSSPRAGMETYKNLYTNNPELLIVDKGHPDYHSMADIVNAGAMSASLVRLIVKQGFKDRFTELYLPYLDPPSIDKLYYAINWGMDYYAKIDADAEAAKEVAKAAKESARAAKKAATPVKSAKRVLKGGRKTRKSTKKSRRKTRKRRKTQKKSRRKTKMRSTI
jgi:hypothetical protein